MSLQNLEPIIITNQPNLDHIVQERGGRLTRREDKRCVESLLAQVTNSTFRLLGHVLKATFAGLHILNYVIKEPEKQSDLVE